ncbi:hypothetical protein WH43_10170 [Rheinheimera sp. KL1]|uniref:6-hydroxymethylpterin diphosphokinase MptE-like protein n=1 Tax=Rheinheimera sp. KL1 TaxID=1635005 RepID=UPI0006A9A7C1|nr:6-hydroxymethylpterin diphosphokinase MptE-like protein [Rheinheimera sp. KL1]KOO58145.1 hypothetical protein WH43_10170 [Rheinheimera sp. KL1]
MLKYINYQILDNAEEQNELEKKMSGIIARNIRQNVDAFRTYIPSMVSVINQHKIQQYSLFCTKDFELNIVDFATGRVFYSSDVKQDVLQEVEQFYTHASYFNIKTNPDSKGWNSQCLPHNIDVLIVFGLGLGYHINELLLNCKIKYLIVYEPSADILLCSVQSNDWLQLLERAQNTETRVFLQIGSDATSLPAELEELLAFESDLDQIFVYRHQFHPVMDDVIRYLFSSSGNKSKLLQKSHLFDSYTNYNDYVSERSSNTIGSYSPTVYEKISAQKLYEKNIAALERFYPEVHKAMLNYKASSWSLVQDGKGEPNLYHEKRNALFHHDSISEYSHLVDYFINHPFRDDIIVNQSPGGKLYKYLHYKTVARIQPLIGEALNRQGKLPKDVDNLIIFGVALGLHIQSLTESHQIKNLFICEPNLDFFAASLYVTDWDSIFKKADENEYRIYLNLGGDGSHYFYDLMSQFYQVGAYSIANTYMLSTYYNTGMQKAIGNLRSELKVVLALGEYYDHARYGIAHTYHGLKSDNRYLKDNNEDYGKSLALSLPVFIVGNGPSLDANLDYIREYREHIVLISCGTALRSLYKNGIRPDFHAEIEQNRATFDWISLIDDKDYLRQIRLLSVNGIHPDTSALFKETLLCFKDGEGSTYVFNNGLKKIGLQSASLSYAYPTVTNLVLNYCLKWGFELFYLFGVDLGFTDIKQHHSKHSAYYKNNGEEIYDYQVHHGGGIPSPGNFESFVYTKPEFDVSRKLLEQAIDNVGRKVYVFNCSNGVKIKNTSPLKAENILLTHQVSGISQLIDDLVSSSFHTMPDFAADQIISDFSVDAFKQTISEWLALLKKDINNQHEAKTLLSEQWKLLRTKGTASDDITFFLFHGSANYISGVLTKIAANISDDVKSSQKFVETFNKVLAIWRDYLNEGAEDYVARPLICDKTEVASMFAGVS